MRIRLLRDLMPALVLAALPAISSAGVLVGVSVNLVPPALPVYVQPPCPEPGYMWTPGYWGWDDGAYYWVPGTWVEPPDAGLLWTPGWWGWQGGAYFWHPGYWGPHVGFYGGVNYGFGYNGVGFAGGYWQGRTFFYNRAVVRVGPGFAGHVYSRPAFYHGAYAHVGFNGGPGGVVARASRAQMMAAHEHHVAFTSVQQRQQRMAFADRSLRADYNHGRPSIAATARPGAFHGSGAFAARAAGGHYTGARAAAHPTAMRSDRPAWASGQRADGGQHRAGRPQQHFAQQHSAQHFSQQHFAERSQGRPQSEPRQGGFRPQGHPGGQRPAAHRQQRGGGHPQQRGGHPQDHHNR